MKASSAVNDLYVHTEDSAVEALLFAVKTVDHCRLCILSQNAAKSPTRRQWFDEVCTCLYCTLIMQLK